MPMSSMQEIHYQLSKTLGLHSSLEGISIPPSEFLGTSFIISWDLERMSSSPGAGMAAFTGPSTRDAGSTLRFSFEGVNPRVNPSATDATKVAVNGTRAWPSRQYVTLHYDCVAELRAEGVLLLD
jgi:hypothetical protein